MNEVIKNQLLDEITAAGYICFSKCYEENNNIYIQKGNLTYPSFLAIREIIDIQNLLERYKDCSYIDISLEGAVVRWRE